MITEPPTRNRCRHEITGQILQLVSAAPQRQTHIQQQARLSFEQLERYLAELTADGHMRLADGFYYITPEGTKRLKELHVITGVHA